MTRAVREFSSEGHRILCGLSHSPSQIAALANVARPRVSEWRSGNMRPSSTDREALFRAFGIPIAAWDAPPVMAVAAAAATPTPARAEVLDVAKAASDDELELLGLPGIANLVRQIAAVIPSLPARERVQALDRQARLVTTHERLRQSATDARSEYFASLEFRRDIETLAAAFPGAAEFRAAVARLGVELTPPPQGAPLKKGLPLDLDELVEELGVVAKFRKAGEARLAGAHLLSLQIEPTVIAAQLADEPKRTAQIFDLLPAQDATRVRNALAIHLAVRDLRGLDATAREKVAELLRLLDHETIADEIGGAPC